MAVLRRALRQAEQTLEVRVAGFEQDTQQYPKAESGICNNAASVGCEPLTCGEAAIIKYPVNVKIGPMEGNQSKLRNVAVWAGVSRARPALEDHPFFLL